MGKSMLTVLMATGLILFAQRSMADTQVYLNFGFPAVQMEEDSCGDYIWIEGHYCTEHTRHVWVPGHWVPGGHDHAVCVQRPTVYHHYHCSPQQNISYRPGSSSGQSHHNGRTFGHEGYDHRGSSQNGKDYGRGQNDSHDSGRENYNHQQNPPQKRYNGQGYDGYRSGGNWMNNINNRVITRQVHSVEN